MGKLRNNNPADTAALAAKLQREVTGDVWFDAFNRGRYATDASHYQIMPDGVVVPRTMNEALRTLAIARDEGFTVTPRGGGTSQCGQTINSGIVVDFSKHLNKLISLDVANRSCVVEPGIVLDELNRQLKAHGLWFPVDVSTASRATIGGMAGNNSCGGRSLRYGTMRDNTLAIDAALADGRVLHFNQLAADNSEKLFADMLALGAREQDEIREKFPKVQRRVGGYNLDALIPSNAPVNIAHLLVGSEGTLAFSTGIELKLWPVIRNKVLGVCHFGSFYQAMDAAQHLVKLKPIAVELVDRTMLALGRDIAMFKPVIAQAVRGDPDCILVVEFAEEDQDENLRRLKQLAELMGDLGFGELLQPAQILVLVFLGELDDEDAVGIAAHGLRDHWLEHRDVAAERQHGAVDQFDRDRLQLDEVLGRIHRLVKLPKWQTPAPCCGSPATASAHPGQKARGLSEPTTECAMLTGAYWRGLAHPVHADLRCTFGNFSRISSCSRAPSASMSAKSFSLLSAAS